MFLLRRSALLARHSARNVHPIQMAKPSLLSLRPAPSMILPSMARRWLSSDVKDTTALPIKQEVDEETLDPEALAAIEADLENMELKDEEGDPDWFVDKVYEQDHPEYQQSDFVPLWQRRAAGDSSLSSAAEEMIKEKKVNLPSVLALLEENKAENIGVIDMRSKCDWTDFMIVAESSRGERFLSSIAEEVVSVVRYFTQVSHG
jgi:Ribosomal silencing factor during starvation